MDRNYYYEKMTKQRQREISQDLATRHLLDDPEARALSAKRVKRMVLRFAPAMIIISLLVIYLIG